MPASATNAYSYVFDGQWGYLDHALASASLVAQVTGAAECHINADEPSVLDYNTDFKSPGQVATLYAPDKFRTSDHDPVIVDLALSPAAESSTTTLTVSPQSQVYGTQTPASWSATVELNRHGDPAGEVELLDGSTVIAAAPVSGGKASGTLPAFLTAGSHTLSARFVPADTDDATGSTSDTQTFTVDKAKSTTGLTVQVGKVKGSKGPQTFVLDMTSPVRLETGRARQVGGLPVDGVVVAEATVLDGQSPRVASAEKGSRSVQATFVPADPANHVGSSSPRW